jgi:hypothetical protein
MRRALVSIAPIRYQRRETTQVAVDGSLLVFSGEAE